MYIISLKNMYKDFLNIKVQNNFYCIYDIPILSYTKKNYYKFCSYAYLNL